MRCEFDYCIYNKEFYCTIKENRINSLGMCESCIMVSIPSEDLEKLKEKQLSNIESEWK